MSDKEDKPARLSEQQVLNWIAFQSFMDGDLTGRETITQKWGQTLTEEPHPHGYATLLALRAQQQGVPFEPPRPAGLPDLPDWMTAGRPEAYEAVERSVAVLVATRAVSIADLIVELEAELVEQMVKQKAIAEARIELENAEHVGHLRRLNVEYAAPPYVTEQVLAVWRPSHDKNPLAKSTCRLNDTSFVAACSDSALETFYCNRVEAWSPNQPPPSGAQDIEAADAHFGSDLAPSRERLREIRKRVAPAAWNAGAGRPRKSRP